MEVVVVVVQIGRFQSLYAWREGLQAKREARLRGNTKYRLRPEEMHGTARLETAQLSNSIPAASQLHSSSLLTAICRVMSPKSNLNLIFILIFLSDFTR